MTEQEKATLREDLKSAIISNPEPAFPGMEWKYDGKHWKTPYHLTADGRFGERDKGGKKEQTWIGDYGIGDLNGESGGVLAIWFKEHPDGTYRELCSLYGIEYPEDTPAAIEKREKRRSEISLIMESMKADLMNTPQGQAVMDYLTAPFERNAEGKSIGGRGWDHEKAARIARNNRIGYITNPEQFERVTGLQFGTKEWHDTNYPTTHPLAIVSQYAPGKFYAKMRCLKDVYKRKDGSPKKWNQPSTQRGCLGVSQIPLFGIENCDFKAEPAAVIVEAELSAISMEDEGIRNVVAVRGKDGLQPHHVTELYLKGCKKIILLYDNDFVLGNSAATARKQASIDTRLQEAIDIIKKEVPCVDIRIARIPSNLMASDADEILSDASLGIANPAEYLKTMISDVASYKPEEYIAQVAADRYKNASTRSERSAIIGEFVDYTSRLRDNDYLKARSIENAFLSWAGCTEFNAADLAEARLQKIHQEELRKFAEKCRELGERIANNPNDTKALAELGKLRAPGADSEMDYTKTTEELMAENYDDPSRSITTSYEFYSSSTEPENLVLRASAITYFAGGSSHGKTRSLQNVAIDVLCWHEGRLGADMQPAKPKKILYYGFEDNVNDSIVDMINIWLHRKIEGLPARISTEFSTIDAISEYLNTQDETIFDKQFASRIAVEIKRFYTSLRQGESKQLYFYGERMTSDRLYFDAKAKAALIHPDAIFVDYVQFLTSSSESGDDQRWADLEKVSKDFIALAKELQIPIVSACQLNTRSRPSAANPDAMSIDDIAASSAIGQGASLVIGVMDSKFVNDGATIRYGGEDRLFGRQGLIMWKVLKQRRGKAQQVAIFNDPGEGRFINLHPITPSPSPEPARTEPPKNEKKVVAPTFKDFSKRR